MNTYNFADFLARSSDKPFAEMTLAKVLAALPAISPSGPWIAGGAVRRTLLGREPDSDFDFFFASEDQLQLFAAALEATGLSKSKETAHHLHYNGRVGDSALPIDVQCIKFKFHADAAAVIDSFDYTICQFAFDGETLTTGQHSLWDLGRHRLAVHRVTYPVASMRRLLKYTTQGFTACAGAMATLLRQTIESPELQTQLNIEYVD